jgi:hypothetical protein
VHDLPRHSTPINPSTPRVLCPGLRLKCLDCKSGGYCPYELRSSQDLKLKFTWLETMKWPEKQVRQIFWSNIKRILQNHRILQQGKRKIPWLEDRNRELLQTAV